MGESGDDGYRRQAKVPGGDLTPLLEGRSSLLMRDLEAVQVTNPHD
ncbi:MAG: hypothetical protein M9894_07870 [Planctomycetes bacterium]|nr:hypothetical protein [Planctomycetota bacterium]